ncbi:uncharacterized protein LOC129761308 [Toxorhynchites rutilus septentrionalis]|uniref:uncharacterized protein LOC129761308 n=1 Tax=Toxorhynchites rutilus septentrionalis TaxID=329112 RepID=UPI002479126C|nr:uncharacterized protein LOC129761308 [Toxorhynchites rutilus septentrionalis]
MSHNVQFPHGQPLPINPHEGAISNTVFPPDMNPNYPHRVLPGTTGIEHYPPGSLPPPPGGYHPPGHYPPPHLMPPVLDGSYPPHYPPVQHYPPLPDGYPTPYGRPTLCSLPPPPGNMKAKK